MDPFREYLSQTEDSQDGHYHGHMDTWESETQAPGSDCSKHTDCHIDYIKEA